MINNFNHQYYGELFTTFKSNQLLTVLIIPMSLTASPSGDIGGDITEEWLKTGYRLYICNFF
jgi:hypothetical protein